MEINFRLANEKDIPYIIECSKDKEYQKYIDNTSNKKIDLNKIYLVEFRKKTIGLVEIASFDKINKNLSFNLFLNSSYRIFNGLCLLKVIDFLFSQYNIHKIIIKVKNENESMIKMLNRLHVICEGSFAKLNIYSIVKNEIETYKDIKWQDLISHDNELLYGRRIEEKSSKEIYDILKKNRFIECLNVFSNDYTINYLITSSYNKIIVRCKKDDYYCYITLGYRGTIKSEDIILLKNFDYCKGMKICLQLLSNDDILPLFLLNGFSIDLILRDQIKIGRNYYSVVSISYLNRENNNA